MTRLEKLLAGLKQDAEQDATAKMRVATAAATAAETKATAASTMASATPSRVRNPRANIPALNVGLARDVIITWSPAFPSANYTLARPIILGTNLTLDFSVTTATASTCIISVKNVSLSNLLAGAATLHVLAVHDPLS